MTFTESLWADAAPILAAIDAHPFVRALGDGTLPRDIFEEYMRQDALYLAEYGRAMGLLAARASDPGEVSFWAVSAQGAIVAERELHGQHVEVGSGTMSATCRAYTSFVLSRAAVGTYGEGVAGILPCFWIYQVVGETLLARAGDLAGHAYGDWIGMYADPAFAEATLQARAIVDRAAERADAPERDAMRSAFLTASRYEWMFWDAAWRQEGWPV